MYSSGYSTNMIREYYTEVMLSSTNYTRAEINEMDLSEIQMHLGYE
jgi:hypothetical protein